MLKEFIGSIVGLCSKVVSSLEGGEGWLFGDTGDPCELLSDDLPEYEPESTLVSDGFPKS